MSAHPLDLQGAGLRCREFLAGYRLADQPTDARPGSVEKMRVMSERIEQRRAIFHRGDASFEGATGGGKKWRLAEVRTDDLDGLE